MNLPIKTNDTGLAAALETEGISFGDLEVINGETFYCYPETAEKLISDYNIKGTQMNKYRMFGKHFRRFVGVCKDMKR
jgi:hypothetical protein